MAAQTKKINIALQGGGAHGAYSWGVLDRLLEEERLEIEGISGTSAGAMNAAIMINGFAKGGREGGKKALEDFWFEISEISAFGPFHKLPFEHFFSGWNLDFSPAYLFFDLVSRVASPYALNPMNLNPLRYILDNHLDWKILQGCKQIKLFVTATHIASGQARVFECEEISTDALLASACIPFLFQAVEVEGEHYWDGGYMGNPALWPLIYRCESEDLLLVQINPLTRAELPKSAGEIINRLNEITFNSSLISEMRAIEFVQRLHAEGKLNRERYKDMKIHLIYSPEALKSLNASSKMNAAWDFFQFLRGVGRDAADQWIKENFDAVGKRSTIDIREKFFLGPQNRPIYGDWDRLGREQGQQQAKKQQKAAKPKK